MSLEKNPTTGHVIEFFGPTIEFVTSPEDEKNDFCVMRGTIPPGAAVPLHHHIDTEDFLVVSGKVEALRHDADGYHWITAQAGDWIHVPSNADHAWRNPGPEPVVNLIVTTKRLGKFLLEAGRPVEAAAQAVTEEDLARVAEISAKYGYWNASPEKNAAVGIALSF